MKFASVTSMSAGLLLIALVSQASSIKLAKQPVGAPPASVQQQEEAIQREQIQQQRQFELLQQQQQQAEYQIQQQQLEADRFLDRPQYAQQQPARLEETKGGAPLQPLPLAPPPPPPPAPFAYERQQYAPPRSTIAYLVVRPPYQAPLPYDDSAYRGYLPPRPQAYPEYPRQTYEAYGTKGGARQENVPPPPPPPAQPALVVPVHGDKHGKLKALLDRILSKLSFSSYEVTGEEYSYPPQPIPPPAKQEPIVQQQQLNIEQIREEPQQALIEQQQQLSVQEQDQGFDEAVKSPKPVEQTKQEVKEELVQQQQQLQEQDFSRQPLAPLKGGQQPVRQPEPIQQQRQEEVKASRRYVPQQPQQPQYSQQEPLREQKGGF